MKIRQLRLPKDDSKVVSRGLKLTRVEDVLFSRMRAISPKFAFSTGVVSVSSSGSSAPPESLSSASSSGSSESVLDADSSKSRCGESGIISFFARMQRPSQLPGFWQSAACWVYFFGGMMFRFGLVAASGGAGGGGGGGAFVSWGWSPGVVLGSSGGFETIVRFGSWHWSGFRGDVGCSVDAKVGTCSMYMQPCQLLTSMVSRCSSRPFVTRVLHACVRKMDTASLQSFARLFIHKVIRG